MGVYYIHLQLPVKYYFIYFRNESFISKNEAIQHTIKSYIVAYCVSAKSHYTNGLLEVCKAVNLLAITATATILGIGGKHRRLSD